MGVSAMLGVFLTFALFLCSTVNSPLATRYTRCAVALLACTLLTQGGCLSGASVTSNIKDVLSTVLGGIMFGDFVPTLPVVSGLIVSFFGGLWFSTLRLRANLAAASESKAKQSVSQQPSRVVVVTAASLAAGTNLRCACLVAAG